ncbi:MAG: anti-toxin [Deltaproteobacteria bacterium]|nr:anti-toxin [Deltaproteobacteria bacterium]
MEIKFDKDIEEKLKALCERTGKSRDLIIQEAIKLFLDEIEDYEIALSRLQDENDPIISSEEMRKRLGL